MTIKNAAGLVPMMFRAQIVDRCQLQRIPTNRDSEPDILPWAREWTQEIYPYVPSVGNEVRTKEYPIAWRVISNSGVDDAIIRPVIGANGWPYYPGSGMKGAFRRACTPAQIDRYCGRKIGKNDCEPGILRFHGGYPVDDSWQDGLVDIAHPQQSKQLGIVERGGSAFAMISLYQPTLQFGISSTEDLKQTEWDEIWQIWKEAIQTGGIGGRVSAGYGQINEVSKSRSIYRCALKGKGQAAKLLDGEGEFRPNIFRAALRGHALRIFGGLTDATSAQKLVGDLFGTIDRQGVQGLLGLNFIEQDVTIGTFAAGTRWSQPTYQATGEVNWYLTTSLDESRCLALKKLLTGLTHFAMTFGGFGKSWRRADHRLFFEDYYEDGDRKPLIGCHWQWADDLTLQQDRALHLWKLEQIPLRIEKLRESALAWMKLQEAEQRTPANWRESWCPNKVQVWGRIADRADDSLAIEWLHGEYSNGQTIYRSQLTGQMGITGRIWHRMYPVIALGKNESDPAKPKVGRRPQFIEILTVFPDNNIPQCQPFLKFLQEHGEFTKVWGDPN